MNTLEMMNEAEKTGLTYWCSPNSGTRYNRDTGFTNSKDGMPANMPSTLNAYMAINTWEPVPVDPHSFKTGDPVWVWDDEGEKHAAWFACYTPKGAFPFRVFYLTAEGCVEQLESTNVVGYRYCIPRVVE